MTYTKLSVAVRLVQRKYLWRLTTMSAFRQLRVPCAAVFLCFSLSLFRACLLERVPSSLPSSTTARALGSHGVHPSLQISLHQITEKSVRVRVRVQPRAGDVLFHFKIAGSWRRTVVCCQPLRSLRGARAGDCAACVPWGPWWPAIVVVCGVEGGCVVRVGGVRSRWWKL
jgi:hypothetical protein